MLFPTKKMFLFLCLLALTKASKFDFSLNLKDRELETETDAAWLEACIDISYTVNCDCAFFELYPATLSNSTAALADINWEQLSAIFCGIESWDDFMNYPAFGLTSSDQEICEECEGLGTLYDCVFSEFNNAFCEDSEEATESKATYSQSFSIASLLLTIFSFVMILFSSIF
mmetsp:Transcript_4385/g.6045  ORF Transcript_4385/g.6045 Transcript_4385/m.6045 type:complete len:172 (-) Transcript_4385:182-697(-)